MPALDIVPVIDLMGGQVVHARAGERDAYRPLRSILAAGSSPVEVVDGLMALHPFRRLYIADLDAIRGVGEHRAVIRDLRRRFPDLDLWVDAGFAAACDVRGFLRADLGTPVLGTESQRGASLLDLLRPDDAFVLSLDFKGEAALDPAGLHTRPELWPTRLIAMTLAAVGAGGGPDLVRLATLRATAPDAALYAAGGVRDAADLARLAGLGCAGVLVASALHDGRLGCDDLPRALGASA